MTLHTKPTPENLTEVVAPLVTASMITANQWFSGGSRIPYDPDTGKVSGNKAAPAASNTIHVFKKVCKDISADENSAWASFLPGWPDGSYGWAKVDQQLTGKNIGHRLFFDHVGHGGSDKPVDYPYSTTERADMVEALWQSEGIKSTFVFAFDYSSIVTLELLARQQDRLDAGENLVTKIEGVLLINGGLYADGHTHPFMSTPILKSWMGNMITSIAQRFKPVFAEITSSLWSKGFQVTSAEIDELYNAIGRRNGIKLMARTADFLKDHIQNAERLNLSRLFQSSKDMVSFHVVGSEEDQFEGRQAILANERLGNQGLSVEIIPGGHLSTSEKPELLAKFILDVVS